MWPAGVEWPIVEKDTRLKLEECVNTETEARAADWVSDARRWIRDDPDPDTARQLQTILDSGEVSALAGCFLPELEFGTAGLRGAVGTGPARMNLATVRRVTLALASVIKERIQVRVRGENKPNAPIVLGFDGRNDSPRFAREAVGVLAATDLPTAFFEQPVPTPLVAFAAQRLASPAAIVVTASHNPPEYSGYKVFGEDAIQIVPPFDTEVTDVLRSVGPAKDVACLRDAFDGAAGNATPIDGTMGDAYVDAVIASRVIGAKTEPIRIAYTPLHGVGAPWVDRVLSAAGYSQFHIESSQREIDGNFPTVLFPNPEEPAAWVQGLRLAREVDADVLLVNDPDADRMGAAIRSSSGDYRILSGNEIGVILTDYLLSHAVDARRTLVASTVVSTPMVTRVTEHYGARFERTLTGFKWLWTAMRAVLGAEDVQFGLCWEEALGYSTHAAVRDKDGIAAALTFADWVSECRVMGVTPLQRLAQLYQRFGAWASAQKCLSCPTSSGSNEIEQMMQTLRSEPPVELAGRRVLEINNYNHGAEQRPPWCGASNLVEIEVEGGARIVVRPSGTEPKLKCYADVEVPVGPKEDPLQACDRARAAAETLNDALVRQLDRRG